MAPRRTARARSAAQDHFRKAAALAHPLRLRLFEVFAAGPRTTKQAAEVLGEPPTRLYHHVYAMERAGLLRLTETRPNRGAVEKYFEAVGRRFEVDPSHLVTAAGGRSSASASVAAMAGTVVDALREDLEVGLPQTESLPEDLRPVLARLVIRASPERIKELRREIGALLQRKRGMKGATPSPAALRYALTIAFLPSDVTAPATRTRARRKKPSPPR